MKRCGLVLMALVMILVPRPASAGWIWAWFEDLSGPKFRGSPWNLRLICVGDSKPTSQAGAAAAFAALDLTFSVAGVAPDGPATAGVEGPRATFDAELRGLPGKAFKILEDLTGSRVKPAEPRPKLIGALEAAKRLRELERPFRQAVENLSPSALKTWGERTADAFATWATYLDNEALTASGSVTMSLCAAPAGGPRRLSIDLNYRSMSDANEDKDKTLSFASLGPAVTFHLLDPVVHKEWDFVDVGMAVSFFWVRAKDESLQPFSGVMVEPIRLDFHAPPIVDEGRLWPLGIPYFQVGYVWFPSGFAARSFAAEGEFSRKYSPEFIGQWSLYFNLTPVVRRIAPTLFGGVKR